MAAPVLITAFGKSKTAAEWARDREHCRVSRNTLKKRIAEGWDPEVAMRTPKRRPGLQGVPLTEEQAAELRAAADEVRRQPKVHRHTPDDAPEAIAIRKRDRLISEAIGRGTTATEIARATGLNSETVRNARQRVA